MDGEPKKKLMRQRVAEPGLDFYATPEWVTCGMIHRAFRESWETLPIWEPACGDGRMAECLKTHLPNQVYCSDIVDRGYEKMDATLDFFSCEAPYPKDQFVLITNPPYCSIDDFILRALDMTDKIAMIGRLAWLEGVDRYQKIYCNPLRMPTAVYVFVRRIKFYKDGDPDNVDNVSGVPHAWFIWDGPMKSIHQDPVIRWIP